MEKKAIQFNSLIFHKKDLNLFYVRLTVDVMTQISNDFGIDKNNRRIWIDVNSLLKWQGGIVALGEGEGYITLSVERMKKLDVHFQDTISISISPDTSEYGIEMALEFEEVLKSDEEARARFLMLKKGLQRYMLYYTIQVKGSEKRLERAIFMLNNLKNIPAGQEDFRRILGK